MMKKALILAATVWATVGCQQGYDFALPSQSDDYIQNISYNNKVDVIFVMDNSSGMDVHNTNLQNGVPTLVNALLAQRLDLHVAVVTTSMGGSNPNGGRFIGSPRYFTSATPNLAGAISQRLSEVGTDGSDLERGLDSLSTVLSPGYRNGQGAGFLRDEALLAIIALSSEDDKSSTLGSGSAPYSEMLDDLKGFYDDGKRRWTMNFIGILSLSGSCPTTPASQYKEPGVRWMDLANQSGGVNESICSSDLSVAASNIKKRIAQILTDFRLSSIPNIDTIRVMVNGQLIPRSTVNGWDYLPSTNVIRFYGSAVPAADASIKIDFTPASAN